jgi:S1-C subfamily serine protease
MLEGQNATTPVVVGSGRRNFMRRVTLVRLFCAALLGLVPVLGAPSSWLPAGAHSARSATITTFYSASKAAYDSWDGSQAPQRTTTFPAGTHVVAVYFEYQAATAGSTTFQIVIRDHTNAEAISGKVHTFDHSSGSEMLSEDYGGAFPSDTYRAELIVDDVRVATTTFTVGAAQQAGVTLTKVILITKAAYDAWDPNSSNDPLAATTFSTASQEVGIFFSYTHARPNVDTFQFLLSSADGKEIGKGKVHPFRYDAGAEALLLPLEDGVRLTSGSYGATLLIDGAPARQLSWTVGGGAPQPPATQPVHPTGPPAAAPACNATSLEQVVRCDEPSVLRVHVQLSDGEAEGTSFVVRTDATGTYLLTNRHVVEGGTADGTSIYSPDGKVLAAHVLAIRVNSGKPGTAGDLAIIRIPATGLRVLHWGDSDKLSVGQTVASIGYGLAFELAGAPSVTEGIISALHRDMGDGYGPAWIQHQSTINHGNSGGPLVDLHGDVVGVNTLSMDQLPSQSGSGTEPVQGIFFAIPSNMAISVANTLISQLENSTTLRDVQAAPPAVSTFSGRHYAVRLPKSWSVNKLSGKDPLFISSDQLVQMAIQVLSVNGTHYSRAQLISQGKKAVGNFGKVRSTSVQNAAVGNMQGVEVSATFSDRRSRLDLFLFPDTSATYLFMVARVVDPSATRGDLQQSLVVINSLHET